MEMIKQRKHTWISRPKRQRSDEQPVINTEDIGGLCYEERNGVIEIGMDAKIVTTYSFEEMRNQIEEKWKEEIKTKMAEVRFFSLILAQLCLLDPTKKVIRTRYSAAEA